MYLDITYTSLVWGTLKFSIHKWKHTHTHIRHHVVPTVKIVLQSWFAAILWPFLQLRELVDKEDANSLSYMSKCMHMYSIGKHIHCTSTCRCTFSRWLHDPCAGWIPSKLLHKDIIISREHECHRDEVCCECINRRAHKVSKRKRETN